MDGWIYDVRHDAVSIVFQSSPVWRRLSDNPQALLMFSQQSESGNPFHLLFNL